MEKTEDTQLAHIKGAVEALLFVNEKPVTLEQIKSALETVGAAEIKKVIAQLTREYDEQKRGMIIKEIAGGYQMLTNSTYASYLRAFYKTKHKEKLSKPALESIAIVAYKQPVTRADVEIIRGVNSDGVMTSLETKELIKIVGKKDVPGKPYLYGTTKLFLEYFGLKSLDDLPNLAEFPDLLPPEEKETDEESSELESVQVAESVKVSEKSQEIEQTQEQAEVQAQTATVEADEQEHEKPENES